MLLEKVRRPSGMMRIFLAVAGPAARVKSGPGQEVAFFQFLQHVMHEIASAYFMKDKHSQSACVGIWEDTTPGQRKLINGCLSISSGTY